jgi:hypothetical protein
VTLVAAPLSGVLREIFTLTVFNKDTVAATITVQYTDITTDYTIIKVALQASDQLIYTDESGWFVFDTNGNQRTV